MSTHDSAKVIKDALTGGGWVNYLSDNWPPPSLPVPKPTIWAATLHVDDDYQPTDTQVTVLVANDGGPSLPGDPWLLGANMRRPLIRLTAFTKGRYNARTTIDLTVDWLISNKPAGITRIENVSEILLTRDRATGAYLASVTMPVITKPIAAA